ncbi:glycosyltransferase family 2 protein [Phocaeicola barnesiae]|uniref:glycosyltransferase family 2 protein n=1 Tax=Phocaeicola barnesiae TaxID=376804 RepID=UPI00242E0BFF|nr:glycosyltransferase family 2 protein [Phocaeicola barnesiae]
MKILSIAIPTYNMEKYLPRCLDSLVSIKSIIPYLEIIIVNDGSKDNSLEVAQSYEKRYPESIIIINKNNGNYGSCINAALKIATGKYFKILDSDDWYDSNSLEEFIKNLKTITVDMVFTKYQTINPDNKIVKHYTIDSSIPRSQILPIESNYIKLLQPQTDLAMHCIAYRTQLLKDINYSQLEGISYTDTEYVFYPIAYIKTVIFYDLTLYQYYVGRNGQTVSISSRIQHSDDMLKIVNRMLNTSLSSESNNIYYLQCGYMTHAIATFYHIMLVLQPLTNLNRMKLVTLDNKIKKYSLHLYGELNAIKCVGIPYIQIWRKFHYAIIPYKLYRFFKEKK